MYSEKTQTIRKNSKQNKTFLHQQIFASKRLFLIDFLHFKLFLIFTKQSAENKISVNNSNAYCGDVTKKIIDLPELFFPKL